MRCQYAPGVLAVPFWLDLRVLALSSNLRTLDRSPFKWGTEGIRASAGSPNNLSTSSAPFSVSSRRSWRNAALIPRARPRNEATVRLKWIFGVQALIGGTAE